MQAEGLSWEGQQQQINLASPQDNDDCDVDAGFTSDLSIVVPPPSHVMYDRALQLEKQQEQCLQWTPQKLKLVDRMLDEVYGELQPTKVERDARCYVIQFVDNFVKLRIPGSSISVFGSFVMDMFTASSDLDLSLNVGNVPVERSRSDKISFLRKLTRSLYGLQNGKNGLQRHSVRKIEPVMRAAVPVVRFVESHTSIECDVSMENMDGVLKSELLGLFSSIDPRFRQLCFLLKAWAKAHDVNDSKKGTLNSLSIILLAAFHLQTRSPPIIPPFSVFLEGLILKATASCIVAVRQRVASYKERGFGRDNKESITQLFASFFIKLLAVESLWEQGLCASPFEGKWVSKVWAKNHLGCMSVEDFAERSQNSARAVREKEFDIIHECFRDTVLQLKSLTSSVSQVTELKNFLFMSKSPKRRSEEPLLQPVEKHAKLSNGWVNGPLFSDPVKEYTSKVRETSGRLHSGGTQQGHYLHVDYNVGMHHDVHHTDGHHHNGNGITGWTGSREQFQGSDRGVGPPMMADQVPIQHMHGPMYGRHPTFGQGAMPAESLHSAAQNGEHWGHPANLLRPHSQDARWQPPYQAFQHGWMQPYQANSGWASPDFARSSHRPFSPSPYQALQLYQPHHPMQRPDSVSDHESSFSWPRPNNVHPQYPHHYVQR